MHFCQSYLSFGETRELDDSRKEIILYLMEKVKHMQDKMSIFT